MIKFDNNSGFNVTDEGSGSVFIDLGSNFNPWQLVADGGYVSGGTLAASGEEAIQFVAGSGIQFISNPSATPKTFKIIASGGGGGGGGADGAQGAQGTQGSPLQGVQGPAGSAQGTQGTQGVQNAVGAQGIAGAYDAQGVQGTVGAAGDVSKSLAIALAAAL
jgi:hypothetical protein